MPSLYLHISIEKIFIIMSYKELCISSLHLLGHIGNMLFKDIHTSRHPIYLVTKKEYSQKLSK